MRPPLPPPLPGFEHIRRTWNATYEFYSARILPGEYYVTQADEAVSTTPGSCIAACIRDRVSGIGAGTRYGNFAMEHLINGILRNSGRREDLEVKIFGGGRILANMTDVGMRNILFVREYLKTEKLRLLAEDVGDTYPRMGVYFPATGNARVKRLRSLHNNAIAIQEKSYIESVISKPVAGDLELF